MSPNNNSSTSARQQIADHIDDLIDALDPSRSNGIVKSKMSWWSPDEIVRTGKRLPEARDKEPAR